MDLSKNRLILSGNLSPRECSMKISSLLKLTAILTMALALPSSIFPCNASAPLASANSGSAQESAAYTLKAGDQLEREIKPGEIQTYELALQARNYFRLLVEQRSANVGLTLFSPDGKKLADVNYQKFR